MIVKDEPPDRSGDSIQQEIERLETAPWRAPRGTKTKVVAWIIIVAFALILLFMIIAIIAAGPRLWGGQVSYSPAAYLLVRCFVS